LAEHLPAPGDHIDQQDGDDDEGQAEAPHEGELEDPAADIGLPAGEPGPDDLGTRSGPGGGTGERGH
jgi:hypothetical protein